MKDRVTALLRNIPVAHRVTVGIAAGAFLLLAVAFVRWVTTPSYTVLSSGLDDAAVAATIGELETLGTPYRIEAGGSRILVPQDELYATRAALAASGVGGASTPQGYELLDGQGLTVSDFRQRVDYQRALEGELAKTLQAMDAVTSATVRLVLPERQLFTENQEPTTASVLLDTVRPLSAEEVETVTFLVSSSVEGLKPTDITVADVDGEVLASPGEDGITGAASTRRQRQTRAFEESLAGDVTRLLRTAVGDAGASVVVRADLDFDERSTERETYDPESAVTTREQTIDEEYSGSGAVPGGAVGVDGGPLAFEGGDSDYSREEATREYGVNREVVRTTTAPGDVEKLSVAIVVDDGSLTGAVVPSEQEIETLVAAALGLDPERGDSVAVSMLPFPARADAEEPATTPITALLPQLVGLALLVLIAIALFVMMRRREQPARPAPANDAVVWAHLRPDEPAGALDGSSGPVLGIPATEEEVSVREQLTASVTTLVEKQPEEIAVLLRSWLADRR